MFKTTNDSEYQNPSSSDYLIIGRFHRCQRRFRNWGVILKMELGVSRFRVSSIYHPVSAGTIIVCCKRGYRGVIDIKRFILMQSTIDLLVSAV